MAKFYHPSTKSNLHCLQATVNENYTTAILLSPLLSCIPFGFPASQNSGNEARPAHTSIRQKEAGGRVGALRKSIIRKV